MPRSQRVLTKALHIGALAKASGRSVHTIRWYEAQGLMPGVERDAGGRRVYVHDHIDYLALLERLRRTGMSIAQMRIYAGLAARGWRSLEERQALLRAHRERVQEEIAELRLALKMIDQKVAYYAEWAAAKKRPPPLPYVSYENRPRKKRTR